jgi:hypothetical protein
MRTGGVLFLDLSRAGTGWSYSFDLDSLLAAQPDSGVWILQGDRWSFGRTWASLDNSLGAALKLYRPRKVGIEAPLPPRAQTTEETGRLALGLTATAEQTCYRFNVEPSIIKCETARSRVIGRAHASDEEKKRGLTVKTAVVAPWIRSMGWRISDHNACDAAVGLAWMVGYSAKKTPARRAA